jgi:HK97 family phage prohead protease
MTTKRYATATLKAVGDDVDYDYDFESVLSAPTLDRDGEVIDSRAFEPLPDHIPIDVDHAMSVEKTVASGQPFYDGDVLMFRGRFASTPLGQLTHTLVKEGHIRSMSVAFMNARTETDPADERVHIRQAELLNAGIVAIPSNREALMTAVKSLAEDVAEVVAEEEDIIIEVDPEPESKSPSTAEVVAAYVARAQALAATVEVL